MKNLINSTNRFLVVTLAVALIIVLTSVASFALDIKMNSLSYEPKEVQIKVGDSVVWKNVAYTDHSATSDNALAEFDTGMVPPGKQSKSFKFTKLGQYKYHCSIHGTAMSGLIVVK